MRKVLKQLEGVVCSGLYNHYRLILTPHKIELKLSPKPSKNNQAEEINWCMDNTKENRNSLFYQLGELNKFNS